MSFIATAVGGVAGTLIGGGLGTATLIGAGVGAAVGGSMSASNAADAQVAAANNANATQWEMYKQSRQDQLPWLQAGQEALGQLPGMIQQGPGDFYASPGYQFNLEEGQRGIDRYNASRGLYASGKASKDLARFSQGLASNEYQNFVNNWIQTKLNPTQSLAQVGQTSAIGLGNQANYTAAQIGQNLQNAGNARASGYINQANAVNQGLQGIAEMYYQNKYLNQQPQIGMGGVYGMPANPYGAGLNSSWYTQPGAGATMYTGGQYGL